MQFFARLSPLRAYQDLRVFLAQRQPYELGFLVLAMAITAILVWAFVKDSYREPVYKPDYPTSDIRSELDRVLGLVEDEEDIVPG